MFNKTWKLEQFVLGILISMAATLQFNLLFAANQLTIRSGFVILGAGVLTLVSQKVRSMADRQREQNELAGVLDAPMTCAPKVAFWSLVSQLLGAAVSFATAPTVAHILIGIYIAGYGLIWRRIYRRKKPVRLDVRRVDLDSIAKTTGRAALEEADLVVLIRGQEAVVLKDREYVPCVTTVRDFIDRLEEPVPISVVPSIRQVTTSNGERLTDFELNAFHAGHCPDCDHKLLTGPSGGFCINILCPNATCGSRFNDMGPFGVERISIAGPNKPAVTEQAYR